MEEVTQAILYMLQKVLLIAFHLNWSIQNQKTGDFLSKEFMNSLHKQCKSFSLMIMNTYLNYLTYKIRLLLYSLFNFGARYYVTRGKVSPYFSAGISNEASFIGKYQYSIPQGQNSYSTAYGKNTFNTFISLNLGTGLNFRLSEAFSLDMQYDVYQYLGKNNYHNAGYSGLIGLKYNL